MPPPKGVRTLEAGARARIFDALATLFRAGIDPGSFDVDEIPAGVRETFRASVSRGRTLAAAGFASGLFNDVERTLVTVGEQSGRHAMVFTWIARWYADQARLADLLRRKTFYPLVTLVVALLVAPLPDLVGGYMTGVAYVLQVGAEVGICLWLRTFGLGRLRRRRMRLGTAIVPWADRDRLEIERDYLALLWLLLAAGVDARAALTTLAGLNRDSGWRKAHTVAISSVERGSALTDCLESSGLIQRAENLGVLRAAEAAGSLSASMQTALARLDESVEARIAERAARAGRVVYAGVMVLALLVGLDLQNPIGTSPEVLESYGVDIGTGQ